MEDYPPEYHTALRLLIPLWRGIPADYKRKYARNIWQQFEDNIRAAAYTSRLSKFINSICLKLQIQIAGGDVAAVSILLTADEKTLLRQLRTEAATLVLMVRLENEKRKEELKGKYDFGLFEENVEHADN